MLEQRQGETYEEASTEPNQNENQTSEGTQDQERADGGEDKLFGIPRKFLLIGGVVLILIIILIVVFMLRKDSGVSSSGETYVYDATGIQLGSVAGAEDGTPVIDSLYNVIGFVSATGSQVLYDEDGKEVARYDPDTSLTDGSNAAPDTVQDGTDAFSPALIEGEEYPETQVDDLNIPSTSTDDTMEGIVNSDDTTDTIDVENQLSASERNQLLRKYGYTGDEIELADSLGLSTQTLVEHARKVQDEATTESLVRMSHKSSKEFRTMQENTMFCMSKITFELVDFEKENPQQYDGEYVVNADYHKCPTYGHQLYVKLKIADGFYAFMTVTPRRWDKLPTDGNMVVHVSYSVTGNKHANMYITNIEEVDSTEITVNPQDSAVSIDEILGDNDYYQGELDELNKDAAEDAGGSQW